MIVQVRKCMNVHDDLYGVGRCVVADAVHKNMRDVAYGMHGGEWFCTVLCVIVRTVGVTMQKRAGPCDAGGQPL